MKSALDLLEEGEEAKSSQKKLEIYQAIYD